MILNAIHFFVRKCDSGFRSSESRCRPQSQQDTQRWVSVCSFPNIRSRGALKKRTALNIAKNQVSDIALAALGQAAAKNNTLQELNLGETHSVSCDVEGQWQLKDPHSE